MEADQRMNGYTFTTVASLRACLRSYGALRHLAENGDMSSATIMIDLARALGDDPSSNVAVLSARRKQAIVLHLINDLPVSEVAKEMGNIRCRVVFELIQKGLQCMLAYLQDGTQLRTWQPWQIDYLRHNAHLTRRELAEVIGKTPNAVGIALHNLRKAGALISTERYSRRTVSRRQTLERERAS